MAEGESPAQAAEAAAIRRRWITLGEILAVIAVLISGLTLWNNYSERSATASERAAEKKQEEARSQALVLKAEGRGRKLSLSALDPAQAIQSQTIAFPSALGVRPIQALVDPRIEAGWIKSAVKKARDSSSAGKAVGDARMPVAITTRFVSGGRDYTDVAVYDVGYRRESSLLGGSEIELLGISMVERVPWRNAQARLDSRWREASR
ncbi:MAG: hypothetical protein ACXW2T_05880 [Allosphingosinicella sp.]